MLSELLKHPRAILLSIALHVVLLGAFFLNFNFADESKLQKQGELAKTVKAEIVDLQQLEAQKRLKQEQQQAILKKELEKKKQAQTEKERTDSTFACCNNTNVFTTF